MSNTFIYEQGWLVEKPEMEQPIQPPKYSTLGEQYKILLEKYNEYIATLRRFKYDYPDPKKEMELGKDFEVVEQEITIEDNYGWVQSCVEVAMPITIQDFKDKEIEIASEAWDAGQRYKTWIYHGGGQPPSPPDKTEYFKQKFNVDR